MLRTGLRTRTELPHLGTKASHSRIHCQRIAQKHLAPRLRYWSRASASEPLQLVVVGSTLYLTHTVPAFASHGIPHLSANVLIGYFERYRAPSLIALLVPL